MICSKCEHEMIKELSTRYKYPNGDQRVIWRCSNSLWCSNERWAHPDGTPLSTEADQETRQCRMIAHSALSMLPKEYRYKWLQRAMQQRRGDAHIGHFTKEQCHEMIQLLCLEIGIL